MSEHINVRWEDPKEEMGKYGSCDTAGVGGRGVRSLNVRTECESENMGEEKLRTQGPVWPLCIISNP